MFFSEPNPSLTWFGTCLKTPCHKCDHTSKNTIHHIISALYLLMLFNALIDFFNQMIDIHYMNKKPKNNKGSSRVHPINGAQNED